MRMGLLIPFLQGEENMAKINLICEHCGGNIILDNSHEIGTCENCYSQFVIKEDKIIQKITQNITKYVYGYEGKDVEELLLDGYKLLRLGEKEGANYKFMRAIEVEPDCWSAWLGYASTGGDRRGYLSIVSAYVKAYNVATDEKQQLDTYVSMMQYIPDKDLKAVFIRAFNLSTGDDKNNIFKLVSGVIGCDDSEIALLAEDLCPDDWRAYFVMGKFRKIRVRWCKLEGSFFTGKHLPQQAEEVLEIFIHAYCLAKRESEDARQTVIKYLDEMGKDDSYSVFIKELKKKMIL